MTTTRTDLLRRMPVFAGYGDHELATVDAVVRERYVAPGADLTTEGDTAREVFVIVSGVADVRRGGAVRARVGAGEVVGEMAVLESTHRSATVTAITPLHVLVLDGEGFDSLLRDQTVARRVAATLSRRLRATTEEEGLPPLACHAANCC